MAYKSSSIFTAANAKAALGYTPVLGASLPIAGALKAAAGSFNTSAFKNPNNYVKALGSIPGPTGAVLGGLAKGTQYALTPQTKTSGWTPSPSGAYKQTTTQSPLNQFTAGLFGGPKLQTYSQMDPGKLPLSMKRSMGSGGPAQPIRSAQTLNIGNAATAGQGRIIGQNTMGLTSWGGQGAAQFLSSGMNISGFNASTGRANYRLNKSTLSGYKAIGSPGKQTRNMKEQKSYAGVKDKENLPTSGFTMRKTISGPDFKMSKHSGDSGSGTIKTSQGKFDIEEGTEVDKTTSEADAAQEKRTQEIQETSKSRAFAEAQARFARKHPGQKLEPKSFGSKLVAPLTGAVTGGISKLGGAYSGFGGF